MFALRARVVSRKLGGMLLLLALCLSIAPASSIELIFSRGSVATATTAGEIDGVGGSCMLGKYRRGAPTYGRASVEVMSEDMAIVDAWACCMLVCVFRVFAKAYKAAKRCRQF